MRVFRVLNSPASTELTYEDREQVDGSTTKNVLSESFLVYDWKPEDTCLPGCYWLEFKLLKMKDRQFFLPGGKWVGIVHTDSDGDFMTGTDATDSSVRVSYGIGDPFDLIRHIRNSLPQILYADPNFIVPVIPTPDQDHYDLWRYIVQLYPLDSDEALRWQIWDRLVHLHPNGVYYNIPYNTHWEGAVHVWTDGNWYTGTSHDDGSVYLSANGVAPPQQNNYNADGIVSTLAVPSFATISGISNLSDISTIDGMTQIGIDFGCVLGVGVEWTKRYPLTGEGFLVQVVDSPTAE